jgi:hypothetical protein
VGRFVRRVLAGAAAFALIFLDTGGFLGPGSARAACLRFQETQFGSAYLVNRCAADINAAYVVTNSDDWMPASSPLLLVPVEAEGRKLLWTRGRRPVAGPYEIKIFSCLAPASLGRSLGGRPVCQFTFADAG